MVRPISNIVNAPSFTININFRVICVATSIINGPYINRVWYIYISSIIVLEFT